MLVGHHVLKELILEFYQQLVHRLTDFIPGCGYRGTRYSFSRCGLSSCAEHVAVGRLSVETCWVLCASNAVRDTMRHLLTCNFRLYVERPDVVQCPGYKTPPENDASEEIFVGPIRGYC